MTMYINLGIVSDAAYLVSRDNYLLDLMTTSTDIAPQFRSRYPFLRIPVQFRLDVVS